MASKRTIRAYDVVADSYEARFLGELAGKPRDRELLEALAARGSGVVLDIGCGPGQIGAYVRGRGRPVVGVDLSRAMARRAAGRLDGALVADMLALPIGACTVADAVAFYSLIHLPRTAVVAAFAELGRVLEPDGHVLVSAHEGDGEIDVTDFLGHAVDLRATFFTLEELAGAALQAGLEVTTAERRKPYDNEGSTVRLYVEARRPV